MVYVAEIFYEQFRSRLSNHTNRLISPLDFPRKSSDEIKENKLCRYLNFNQQYFPNTIRRCLRYDCLLNIIFTTYRQVMHHKPGIPPNTSENIFDMYTVVFTVGALTKLCSTKTTTFPNKSKPISQTFHPWWTFLSYFARVMSSQM